MAVLLCQFAKGCDHQSTLFPCVHLDHLLNYGSPCVATDIVDFVLLQFKWVGDSGVDFLYFCCYDACMAGRPKKPESETLGYMLRIRMSHEDRKLLEQAAKLKSLQLSTWARSELVALARVMLEKKPKK